MALDTNVLLDLAEGNDFAHEFREAFQARAYQLYLPPTAAGELNFISLFGGEKQKKLAGLALRRLLAWKCQPLALPDVELFVAERFSRDLAESGIIPEDEWNDGRILAETSLAHIPLLVTSDKHLLHIDEDRLLLAFNEADLAPVHPVHPKRLLRALH